MKSVYIHIPFCKQICSYCDFCKFYYNEDLVNKYLNELYCEVKERYQNELIQTIYIGGGTPSILSLQQLDTLFKTIDLLKLDSAIEFTFECNIEDINEKLLCYLKKHGVTRLSIGIQTFNKELLRILNREYDPQTIERIKLAKQYFDINIDLIYAIPNQTLENLEKDLDILLSLDVDHISTYSLIIEKNTKLYIDGISNISEDLDLQMYELITKKLSNYNHYEISNFAKKDKACKHNLTYWNNENYYGFGLGSSGYINNVRYDNTKSINKYLNHQYVYQTKTLTDNETIENEFILGLRKTDGVDKEMFYQKYHLSLNKINVINELLKQNKLKDNKKKIYIPSHLLYTSNDVLVNFLDIDYKNIV